MSHNHHHNHPRPHRPSPTGSDSHSGSLYSEGRIVSPVPTNVPNTNPAAQRSTPVPNDPLYYPLVQQQQTHPSNPTFPSYQQISEARYHSDSYNNGASPAPDPQHPPPFDIPGDGRWKGHSNYASHPDLQIPPSSDLRSPHSVYSPASSFLQYQSLAGSAHPAEHSPSREAVHTVTAASQQSMGMNHASLERTASNSRGPTQLPYPRVPTASSPVPYDLPPEPSYPTIKKRKRADARQLEALNGMYARTAFPSTEERQQLARDLDMSARSVQIWFKNKRQASRQLEDGPIPTNPPTSQVNVTLFPPFSAALAFLAGLTIAFIVARNLGGAAA